MFSAPPSFFKFCVVGLVVLTACEAFYFSSLTNNLQAVQGEGECLEAPSSLCLLFYLGCGFVLIFPFKFFFVRNGKSYEKLFFFPGLRWPLIIVLICVCCLCVCDLIIFESNVV